MQYMDLDSLEVDPEAVTTIDKIMAEVYCALPFSINKKRGILSVVFREEDLPVYAEDMAFVTKYRIEPFACLDVTGLKRLICKFYGCDESDIRG